MAKRKKYDWEGIEAEYRANQLTVTAVARKFGCTEGAIRYRAKKEGWKKDLTEKVQQEVKAELLRGELRGQTKGKDREIVAEAGKRGAEVVRYHRQLLKTNLESVLELTDGLTKALVERKALENELEAEKEPEKQKLLLERLKLTIPLPNLATMSVSISTAMKNYIGLERQAYNLDTKDGKSDLPTMILHDPKNPERDV